MEQLVTEYEASGLGRTAFCQEKGLSLSTLSRYRRRQEQSAGEAAERKRWLAVEVSGSGAVAGMREPAAWRLCVPAGGGSKWAAVLMPTR